jgi:SAM-dependent methyltransferase
MATPDVPQLAKLDARIPSWDTNGLEERCCPICTASGEPRVRRPDGLIVNYCGRCGTYYVSPGPTEAALGDFYRTYYARHSRIRPSPGAIRFDPATNSRVTEIASNLDLRGKRVLDVGCGWGETLHIFRQLGAEVWGLDLDPDAVRYAHDCLGLADVRLGELKALAPGERFDLITMFDVIEHPLRPMAMLREAVARLEPGGVVALWTPNATFVSRENQPVQFRVDLEHMQYLTTRSCNYTAPVLGLAILHLESVGFPDLTDIETLRSKDRAPLSGRAKSLVRAMRGGAKSLVRAMPGFRLLQSARHNLSRRPERQGAYHLFCLFRKEPMPT